MSIKDEKHKAVLTRILEGDGTVSRSQRRAAFDNAGLVEPLHTLIDKVARQPVRITDEDIAEVKAAGLKEDEIFELVICAAIGQATRQYEMAMGALSVALNDAKGSEHAPRDPQ